MTRGSGGGGTQHPLDLRGGVGCHAGYQAEVLGEETLEAELIGVAVVVCFAGWFPDDSV